MMSDIIIIMSRYSACQANVIASAYVGYIFDVNTLCVCVMFAMVVVLCDSRLM